MSFSIIKMETRLANMVTWFAGLQNKITDFVVGGKTRTKFEAIAQEMESQDFHIYRAIIKAIRTSVYQTFDFNLEPAARAAGLVTFSASPAPASDIPIPAGTRVATVGTAAVAEIVYETTVDVTLLAGTTSINAPVSCTVAGVAGNT